MEEKNDTNVAEGNKLTVTIDSKFLNCHICHCPLEPPVFQCKEIHFVCNRCSAENAGECSCKCSLTSCPSLDALVLSATVCCPNSQFGCQEKYPYYSKFAHERYCSFDANFFCPHIRYCTFQSATPEELTSHFKSKHSTIYCEVRYDKEFECTFRTNGFNYMLVTGEDGRSFLVGYERSRSGFYVSLLCMGSESAAEDLCYEITSHAPGYFGNAMWSMKSTRMICIRRWMGINDKCSSLSLPSRACSQSDDGEFIIRFTVCIRKK